MDNHRKIERKLWLPNERAWKKVVNPKELQATTSSSIEDDLRQIKHIYYDKVHKKHPVFVTPLKRHKKIQIDRGHRRRHQMSTKVHKARRKSHSLQNKRKSLHKKLNSRHKAKKLKNIIKNKKMSLKKHKKKKSHKKHLQKKKRKLKVNMLRKKSNKKKRKLSGPKATPNLAVDDTKLQIRTFTRLPKQTQIINNALATGTKIIQPRIYLPSNQYTRLI